MANYILILVWLAFVAFLAKLFGGTKDVIILDKQETRYNIIWGLIFITPLIIWAANRGYFADTTSYIMTFRNMPDDKAGISEYMETVTKDELFYYTSTLIKVYITQNVKFYLGIVAAFQAIVLAVVYTKYSENVFISMFLFLASTDYISWMFNGIRQFTAVCICFACAGLIFKKKYIPAILLIVFASFFHQTALLVLPFLFIAQGKAWNKKTLLFIFGVIIAVAFIDRFTNILDSVLEDTQYTNVVTDWNEWKDDGTNVIRVIVYSVPAIISLYGKKTIDQADNQVINICTNMSVVSTGIYIVSIFTSGIFIGRLPIYFSLYSYILLPWEMNHVFSDDMKKIVKIIMFVMYLIFYVYSIHNVMGLI